MKGFRRSLQKMLRSIDLFGQNILLNLNGEDQYKTAFGGIFTVMILGIVVLFFQSNIREFLDKVNIQSETTETFEDQPDSITLNDSNFMFAVAIEQTNFNTQPFFNITIRARKYERLDNGTLIKQDQFIDLIPCTSERFSQIFSQYGVNFTEQYKEIGLDTWLCPQVNYSMSMKGRYTNKFFDFVKIAVSECSNETQSNSFFTWKPTCASPEVLEQWLIDQRSYRLKLYITNKVINPLQDDYIQSFLDDELFFSFVPNVIGKETDVFFTKYLMDTDNNLLPVGSDIQNEIHLIKEQGDYRDQSVFGAEQYGAIYLRRSPFTKSISRSYQKLDKLLSLLGGFANIVFVVLGFFVGMYNKQLYLIELANEVYDFHFGKENKSKFERQELVKEITYLKSQSKIVSQRHSPASSINNNQLSSNNQLVSINPLNALSLKQKMDCTLVIQKQRIDEQVQVQENKITNNLQPPGDNEIEWESLDHSAISSHITQNNNQTDVGMFQSTAKFNQDRQTKTQADQEKKNMKSSIKQALNKIGIHNRKEYLTRQIQMMLDRSKPIIFTFKFVLHQLFCGKFFQDKNCVLLDKAIKKINQDLDICVLIDKINEINLIKELLLEKDQQILFNFAPKEVISIEEQASKHLPGRRDSKRAFTKRLGVQFGDVAKMMFDKKFKSGQFVNPGLQIYYKLYQAYEKVILSDAKNERFNQILIQKLGQEVKEVFDISNYIQGDNSRRIIGKLRKKKEDEVDEIPGLLSMDQRDMKQSMIK